ncbi:MAG TPA: hypothetical protein VHC49_02130 [Mycobacteriales bacterium]|nr:hypothetical protein [Mycobacteriales bacterium]
MPNDEFRPPARPDAPERHADTEPDPIANTQAFRAFAGGGSAEPEQPGADHRNLLLVVVPVLIVVVIAIVVITVLVS